MELWISAEHQHDVGAGFDRSWKKIEPVVNAWFAEHEYGEGLKEWTMIAIILPNRPENAPYTETRKYVRRTGSADFRLRIDHAKFKRATPGEQVRMLWEILERSLEMLPSLKVTGIDHEALLNDLKALAVRHRWRSKA